MVSLCISRKNTVLLVLVLCMHHSNVIALWKIFQKIFNSKTTRDVKLQSSIVSFFSSCSLLLTVESVLCLVWYVGEGGSRGTKRRKTEESESSEEGSDEERPRKRGRPRVTPRENIKGFTDQEVSCVKRWFIHAKFCFCICYSYVELLLTIYAY